MYLRTSSVHRGALLLLTSINERWCCHHVGCERQNPAGTFAKRVELWRSTKLYSDLIHLKITLTTATLPIFTKREVATFSKLWTKKLKCFWLPMNLLPMCLCVFFVFFFNGSCVASWGCGWILSPSFHSSLASLDPSRAKKPHTCTSRYWLSPPQQTEHPVVDEASLIPQFAERHGVGLGCRVGSVF